MEPKTGKLTHNQRNAPLAMPADEFREAGHALIERIAAFLETLPNKPVTSGEQPASIRAALGADNLPEEGSPASSLIEESADLLFEHSLFNGHPRFWGYITSSAAPIGALGDLLAAAVNPNVGAYVLSPAATEIEAQAVRWIAELIGYPTDCAGTFVSGGNMANFVGFLAGRRAKATWDIRKEGLVPAEAHGAGANRSRLVLYCAEGTHTWIQKAADLFGHGTDAVRWVRTDSDQRMDLNELERQVLADKDAGNLPFMVVGTAGSVGTGSIDPLAGISRICQEHDLWFHVDGAYGAMAGALPEYAEEFDGLARADSLALDPHKWLYAPLEAGCIMVRNRRHLTDAFGFHPEYYNFDGQDEPLTNFHEYSLQNSRGFRALKVWLGLRQAGRNGYVQMIRDDIALAKNLFQLVDNHPEMQAVSTSLSITTFRYVPAGLTGSSSETADYLNRLNEELLNRLQSGGEAFVSNAIVDGRYCLRMCIVNFRTEQNDIEALVEIVARYGAALDAEMRGSDN